MKKGLIIGIIGATSLYLLSGCGNSDRKDWDSGYDSAWEDKEAPSSFWDTKAKREGYELGRADADAYDEGYHDGRNGHGPKYTKDAFYMDGYKQGKKDKRY
jgi:hypothetical protein